MANVNPLEINFYRGAILAAFPGEGGKDLRCRAVTWVI